MRNSTHCPLCYFIGAVSVGINGYFVYRKECVSGRIPLFGGMTHPSRSVRDLGTDITRLFTDTLCAAMTRLPWSVVVFSVASSRYPASMEAVSSPQRKAHTGVVIVHICSGW